MKRRLICFVFVALMAIPAIAGAQDAPPADAPPAGDIVKLNEDGIAAFQAGNFEEAATKFRQAYEIQPENTLKKNEAVAWFKAGNCENALRAGREFLALADVDELSQTEARAVTLQCDLQLARTAVDAGDLDKAEQHTASARINQPDPQAVKQLDQLDADIAAKRKIEEEARQKALADAEARRKAEQAAAANDGGGSSSALGLGLMSGGGALLVGTLVYHVVMLASVAPKFRDVAAAGDDRARYDDLGKKLETANWLVPTLYAVGAVTTGVGVWFWMQSSAETDAAAAATASPRRAREFGVSVGWRF